MNLAKTSLLVALLATLCSSCTLLDPTPKPNPSQEKLLRAGWMNPHPVGSYAYFTAEPSYPKTYKVYKNHGALAQTNSANARVKIDLSLQRAILYKGDQIAMDYPIASGKSTFPTPPGSYQIVEKKKAEKRSNLYGTIYNSSGNVHKSNADIKKDKVPPGGQFKGASMPYWMRLSWSGIGMHQGRVPRYPASHGCVRMPSSVASTVFSKTGVGTPVSIVR